MPQMFTYICSICRKTSRIADGDPIPVCCGQLMKRYGDDAPPAQKDVEDDKNSIDSVLR